MGLPNRAQQRVRVPANKRMAFARLNGHSQQGLTFSQTSPDTQAEPETSLNPEPAPGTLNPKLCSKTQTPKPQNALRRALHGRETGRGEVGAAFTGAHPLLGKSCQGHHIIGFPWGFCWKTKGYGIFASRFPCRVSISLCTCYGVFSGLEFKSFDVQGFRSPETWHLDHNSSRNLKASKIDKQHISKHAYNIDNIMTMLVIGYIYIHTLRMTTYYSDSAG